MKDEQMQSLLDAWYRDRDEGPRDADSSVSRVMAGVPQVRQRSRWWPFPIFYRRTETPTATDTTEYQPGPIPAMNGRTPTVIGRTMTMFSPAKTIIAAALVFGVGGVMLVAQPFQPQSTVPAATVNVEPVWVTGNIQYAVSCRTPSTVTEGSVRHNWTYECRPQTWTASDPRFSGKATERFNDDLYVTDNGTMSVTTSANFLTNDDGGWACSSSSLSERGGTNPGHLTGDTSVCVGQGGYEGLSAILVIDRSDPDHPFSGLIFSGDFPPVPLARGLAGWPVDSPESPAAG